VAFCHRLTAHLSVDARINPLAGRLLAGSLGSIPARQQGQKHEARMPRPFPSGVSLVGNYPHYVLTVWQDELPAPGFNALQFSPVGAQGSAKFPGTFPQKGFATIKFIAYRLPCTDHLFSARFDAN